MYALFSEVIPSSLPEYPENGSNTTSSVTGVFNVINYYDSNTTYSAMSVAEMKAGTATSSRSIRADYLKSAFTNSTDGIIRTGTESGTLKVFGTDIQVKDCGDFVITATAHGILPSTISMLKLYPPSLKNFS